MEDSLNYSLSQWYLCWFSLLINIDWKLYMRALVRKGLWKIEINVKVCFQVKFPFLGKHVNLYTILLWAICVIARLCVLCVYICIREFMYVCIIYISVACVWKCMSLIYIQVYFVMYNRWPVVNLVDRKLIWNFAISVQKQLQQNCPLYVVYVDPNICITVSISPFLHDPDLTVNRPKQRKRQY